VFSSTDEVLVGDVEISLSEGDDEDDDDARDPRRRAAGRRGSCRRRESSSAASREVDPRMVGRGEVLEATLREFGVDARLVVRDRRPDRHPLRARDRRASRSTG
jgi:hypothetical protein